MFDIIYIVYFMLAYLIIGIMLASEIMYFEQNEGYIIKSLFKILSSNFKENILNAFMNVIIIVCMFVLDINYIYVSIFYLLFETSLWLWAGNQFSFVSKIKYTKRVCRQLILLLVLLFFSAWLFLLIDYYYLTICFPLLYVIIYFILFFDYVLLYPVEKIIGRYFLKSAKKKLRENSKLIKIGITGSYGKTSVKEILYSILSQENFTLATPKSYNTPFGIAKTINENLKNSHQIFICEMGAKKRGEINELCKLVNVDCGIVTSVGRQHTETFGSIENIYKTKKELPDYLYKKFCVFNLMNYYVNSMYDDYIYTKIGVFLLPKRPDKYNIKSKLVKFRVCKKSKKFACRNIYFEFNKTHNVYSKNIRLTSEFSEFDIYYDENLICHAQTSLIGIHNVINVLLAVAMSIMLDIQPKNIASGIKKLKSIKARFEKTTNNLGAIIINNGYNSNLDSARYSLSALNLFDNKNKLVVTPGLIECKDMYEDNYKFGKLIGKFATDVIIVKKINMEAIHEGLKSINFNKSKIYFAENFECARKVIEKLTNDYVVLIENDLPDNFK